MILRSDLTARVGFAEEADDAVLDLGGLVA